MITTSTFYSPKLVKRTVTEKYDAEGNLVERQTQDEYVNDNTYYYQGQPYIVSQT